MNIKNKILIDVGSSTIKVYKYSDRNLTLLFTRSIPFKKDFNAVKGISEENKNDLYQVLSDIKKTYKNFSIKLYATAIFRQLDTKTKVKFIDELFRKTGLFFNIISHELENYYLEVALTSKYDSKGNLLMVNIGGGSTELVIMKEKKPVERHNIALGIGNILTQFPRLNEHISPIALKDVVLFVKKQLPAFSHTMRVAFYNGGELRYMQLVGYKLQKNKLFTDLDHPSVISIENFKKKNNEIFNKLSLSYLESCMPEDPKWMHGARACSAIAQAIFEKYKVKTIIPSNSNLVDGVVRKEFRRVTISGSFRKHLEYILKVKEYLLSQNIQVLSPRFHAPKNPGEEFVIFEGEENSSPIELERFHLDAIDNSDALIVCNPNGYVGFSAMIEIGFAHSQGKRIIFTEIPEEFMLNTLPGEVGL